MSMFLILWRLCRLKVIIEVEKVAGKRSPSVKYNDIIEWTRRVLQMVDIEIQLFSLI